MIPTHHPLTPKIFSIPQGQIPDALWVLTTKSAIIDLPELAHHSAVMKYDKSPFLAFGKALNHMNRSRFPFFLSLSLLAFGALAVRADWPEFRGPWGDGHVAAPGDTHPIGLPLHWSETNNVKWKTEIPHRGW